MSTDAPFVTAADGVTLAGLGLGLWWSMGGPAWAGGTNGVAPAQMRPERRRRVRCRAGSERPAANWRRASASANAIIGTVMPWVPIVHGDSPTHPSSTPGRGAFITGQAISVDGGLQEHMPYYADFAQGGAKWG